MLVGFAPIVGQRLILITLIGFRIVTAVRSWATDLGRLLVFAAGCALGPCAALSVWIALIALVALIALLARAPLTETLRASAALIVTRA